MRAQCARAQGLRSFVIATVEVDYNDRVKQGQVLARFDRASLAAQLAQTEATLAASRAALERARTDRERVARDRVRVDRLHEQKVIPDSEHDNATSASRMAEQRCRPPRPRWRPSKPSSRCRGPASIMR